MAMITFDAVSKKYPTGVVALDDVSFQIDDNEFVFLVGASGAGKTTILRLLLKQMEPTSGSIFIDKVDITAKGFKDSTLVRRNIGIVFQDFKILHDKDIFENVALSLQVTGAKEATIKSKVEEVLDLVGLSEKKRMFPLQLSAGELQRVAIARAIIGDRGIILADEPTGNLDPKTTWEIMKIFKKLDGQKTLLIATHNADIVNSFKKRVITVKDGKVQSDRRGGTYEL